MCVCMCVCMRESTCVRARYGESDGRSLSYKFQRKDVSVSVSDLPPTICQKAQKDGLSVRGK